MDQDTETIWKPFSRFP